jgi:hypothetical protein
MQHKAQISFIAVSPIVKMRFVRWVNARNRAILCNYTIKNIIIHGKTNVSIHTVKKICENSRVSCTIAADIPGYIYYYFNKIFHDSKRTFNFLCGAYHLPMISQNFVECKQNFKN